MAGLLMEFSLLRLYNRRVKTKFYLAGFNIHISEFVVKY